MTNRSPGTPLNPAQVAGAQGIPVDTVFVQSHVMHVGGGQYSMCTPVVLPIPVQHAAYRSSDVPFIPMRTDYKP